MAGSLAATRDRREPSYPALGDAATSFARATPLTARPEPAQGGTALTSLTTKGGGKEAIIEPLWDRQPNDVARFSVQATSLYFACIANGTSRMYHSADLLRCADEAGLELDEDRKLGTFHTLMVFKPERAG